jgi:tetratricopeptide (TPR) repeat protein
VEVQIKSAEGMLHYASGNISNALKLLESAADMEDSVAKHPVTPGEVLPARELFADMLLKNREYEKALNEYELVLGKSPGRFNSLYGASVAAAGAGNKEKAGYYLNKLPTPAKDSIMNALAAIKPVILK